MFRSKFVGPTGIFLYEGASIKSRSRAPPVRDTNLTLCVGQDFAAVVALAGPGKVTLDLVVAVPAAGSPSRTGRPWLSRTTGGQDGRPGPGAGSETIVPGGRGG